MEGRNLRKTRQGVVVSNKMDKTIVVAARFKDISKTKRWRVVEIVERAK